MQCDCGHKAERAILTARGLVCFECKAARVCLSQKQVPAPFNRDNATKELSKAQKRLRKMLPLEWSDERLEVLARRLVRNQ